MLSENRCINKLHCCLFLSLSAVRKQSIVDVESVKHASRISEAMQIASLVSSPSSRSFRRDEITSRREVARQNQTSAYCSAGRIQWRVHNTRARTTKSAPDASNVRNTGPRVRNESSSLPPSLSFSVSLSRSFHYLFSKTRRHHPRFILNPLVRFLRPRGCETA